MRKYITLILILIGLEAFAQPYVKQFSRFEYVNGQRFDSTFRIFNLPTFTGDTVIAFNPYTKKIGLKVLSSSGGIWGSITGTLSNQTDLQNALNLKLNISDTAAMLSPYALSSEVPTYLAGNGIIKGGVTFYRDSLKSTGQYGNSWQNGMYLGSSNNRSMVFRTNGVQRMKLDSNGRVLMGVTPSVYKLRVQGTDELGVHISTVGGNAANPPFYFTSTTVSSDLEFYLDNTNVNIGPYANKGIQFVKNAGSDKTMVITNTGNVTIGATTDISKLAIPIAPTSTANSGLFSLSNTTTAFDGSTTGKFVGAATGTYFAVNSVGSVAYNYLDFQKNGLTRFQVDSTGKNTFASTITAGGTTGDQTINKPSGTVNIAAAGTTVTVTNSLVSTSSIVVAVVRTNDTTAYIKNVVPSAGSFVITLGAACTSETSIGFIVYN
jgi:hypothetical protein